MIWSQQELSESDLMGPHERNYIVTSSTEMVRRVAKQQSVFRFMNFYKEIVISTIQCIHIFRCVPKEKYIYILLYVQKKCKYLCVAKTFTKVFQWNSLSHRLEDLEIGRWSPGCDTWVESCGGNATGGKLLEIRRSWVSQYGFSIDVSGGWNQSPFGGWKLKQNLVALEDMVFINLSTWCSLPGSTMDPIDLVGL